MRGAGESCTTTSVGSRESMIFCVASPRRAIDPDPSSFLPPNPHSAFDSVRALSTSMHDHDSPASSSSTARGISTSPVHHPTSSFPTTNDNSTGHTVERPRVPPLACMRYSPRPCVNQELVDALKPLRDFRFAEFGCESPRSYPSGFDSTCS
jgi:hypothetical protein